ncbi:unnamed protein product [Discosporangium mesarthrocarpum]
MGDADDDWGDAVEEEVVVWSGDAAAGPPVPITLHPDITMVEGTGKTDRSRAKQTVCLAALANLSISYHVVNISLALEVMRYLHNETIVDESLASGAAVFGMITGQVIFGVVGDAIGREWALIASLLVCAIGALGSALFTFDVEGDGRLSIYEQLIIWRILVGLGAGGVYPLASTLARESRCDSSALWEMLSFGRRWNSPRGVRVGDGVHERESLDSGSTAAVAFVFSMQGVGYFSANFVGFILLCLFPDDGPLVWRLHLGLGALPTLTVAAVVYISNRGKMSRGRRGGDASAQGLTDHCEVGTGDGEQVSRSRHAYSSNTSSEASCSQTGGQTENMCAALCHREWLMKLLGTAGSWFLCDVMFYGNTLYEGDVLEAAFGERERPLDMAWQNSILTFIGVPGYFLSVALVDRLGPWIIQVQGFIAMAVIFSVMGIWYNSLRHMAVPLIIMYSLTFFFNNFGPNSSTFMLPSLTFPAEVRGTFSGLSAAAGKMGALLGSVLFPPAAEVWGVETVLGICASISVIGGLLTVLVVSPSVGGATTDPTGIEVRMTGAGKELSLGSPDSEAGGANGNANPARGSYMSVDESMGMQTNPKNIASMGGRNGYTAVVGGGGGVEGELEDALGQVEPDWVGENMSNENNGVAGLTRAFL